MCKYNAWKNNRQIDLVNKNAIRPLCQQQNTFCTTKQHLRPQ
jgi:hypothetical protein